MTGVQTCALPILLVVDGVVKSLNVEAPGKFEVSDAETILGQARALKR